MPQPRKPHPAAASPKSGRSWFRPREWLLVLKPDVSGPGLRRLAIRGAIGAIFITCLTALADWSARGFLRPGGIDRLIAMKETPTPSAEASARTRGKLDRGRLQLVISASSR